MTNHPAGSCYMQERDDDYNDDALIVLSEKTVTARIGHQCDSCDGPIYPGTRYLRVALLVEGRFSSFCNHGAGGCPQAPAWQVEDGAYPFLP